MAADTVTIIWIGLLGGLVTGISPCVLPLLPAIFVGAGSARPDSQVATAVGTPVAGPRPALGRPVKIVAGLIVSFAAFTLAGSALLAALGLPSGLLRWAGVVILALVGLGLIFPRLEEMLQRPFARLPGLTGRPDGNPFVLGLALGTLYVPCAGPVLAAIAVAGATGAVDGRIVALTLAFSLGAAIPLFFFALAGAKVGRRLAAQGSRFRRFRVAGGAVMVLLAVALSLNATDALQRAVPDYTAALQPQLPVSSAAPTAGAATTAVPAVLASCTPGSIELPDCGVAPSLQPADRWFNSDPLNLADLHGKVVIVDFWTYSCINCQRSLPYVQAWYGAYAGSGLEVIGVHSPEFSYEHDADNVARAIADQGYTFPVAMDNSFATWTNFHNHYWPALYLIDGTGHLRYVNFGEGSYDVTEGHIRTLLTEADPAVQLPASTIVA